MRSLDKFPVIIHYGNCITEAALEGFSTMKTAVNQLIVERGREISFEEE